MTAAVSIVDVVKNFGALQALAGVSLEIGEGEFFGLLGPNGAGKTTLISTLAGLLRADSGRLSVLGHDVVRDYRVARRLLGVVPQELVFDPFFSRFDDIDDHYDYEAEENDESENDESENVKPANDEFENVKPANVEPDNVEPPKVRNVRLPNDENLKAEKMEPSKVKGL